MECGHRYTYIRLLMSWGNTQGYMIYQQWFLSKWLLIAIGNPNYYYSYDVDIQGGYIYSIVDNTRKIGD